MKHPNGFSVTELLIGLMLAMFILQSLVIQYMQAKRHSMQMRHALDSAYELPLVADFIRDSVRRAGFTPCFNLERLVTKHHEQEGKVLKAIQLEQDNPSQLTIQRMDEHFDVISTMISPERLITTRSHFKENQLVLIADCHFAEVHRIKSLQSYDLKQNMTLTKPLMFHYKPPIYIGEWLEERFYFKKQGSLDGGALFYRLIRADELLPNVTSFSVRINTLKQRTFVEVRINKNRGEGIQFETWVRT